MQRSIHLNRSPLSKLLARRAKARPERLAPAAEVKPRSSGPPASMAEQLSRTPEIRITNWL